MRDTLTAAAAPRDVVRRSGSLPTPRARRRYGMVLGSLILLAVVCAGAVLAWDNPMPVGSEGFWTIAELRGTALLTMAIVAVCQAVATVSFQTVTNNRIITPSIMGFEALYVAVQTSAVYFLGVAGLVGIQGLGQFALQVALMVGLALALYTWLLTGRYANLQVMLLIGIVIGGGLGSVSAFMQRLLTPSEFDVLSAQLFGSMANADPEYFPLAIPLVVVAATLLFLRSRRLDVMALGRDAAMGLGVSHRRELIVILLLVSILMAVSTALVGPLTFLGFLVAMLTYQLADTFDHRLMLPVAVLTAFVVLCGAYFVMKHVFSAQGVVSIIIELVGGTAFLVFLLRKGRL